MSSTPADCAYDVRCDVAAQAQAEEESAAVALLEELGDMVGLVLSSNRNGRAVSDAIMSIVSDMNEWIDRGFDTHVWAGDDEYGTLSEVVRDTLTHLQWVLELEWNSDHYAWGGHQDAPDGSYWESPSTGSLSEAKAKGRAGLAASARFLARFFDGAAYREYLAAEQNEAASEVAEAAGDAPAARAWERAARIRRARGDTLAGIARHLRHLARRCAIPKRCPVIRLSPPRSVPAARDVDAQPIQRHGPPTCTVAPRDSRVLTVLAA